MSKDYIMKVHVLLRCNENCEHSTLLPQKNTNMITIIHIVLFYCTNGRRGDILRMYCLFITSTTFTKMCFERCWYHTDFHHVYLFLYQSQKASCSVICISACILPLRETHESLNSYKIHLTFCNHVFYSIKIFWKISS